MKTIARSALALDNDGRIVVGGQFTTLGGVPRRRLARLNTGLNADESFRGDGFDDEAHPLADRTRDAGSRRTRSERRRHTRPQQPVAPVDNGWSGANPLVPPPTQCLSHIAGSVVNLSCRSQRHDANDPISAGSGAGHRAADRPGRRVALREISNGGRWHRYSPPALPGSGRSARRTTPRRGHTDRLHTRTAL